jgi:hypothetical protein
MMRLACFFILAVGCAPHGQVNKAISNVEDQLGPPSSSLDAPNVFAWSIQTVDGQTHDDFSSLRSTHVDDVTELLLLPEKFAPRIADNQLRAFSKQMLVAAQQRQNIIAHQGQLKHHMLASASGDSHTIRSIAEGGDQLRACVEMRKLFTQTEEAKSWLSPQIRESWRRIGLTETAPTLKEQSSAVAKAFLHLDLRQRVSKLYIYEEGRDQDQSELVEIVVACTLER